MWIYKWNVKIAGIGWGFSPENTWNIGDVLERTSTWYEWDWALWTRVSTLEWEIVLKANTADVYDKTAIDTKVQQLEDEIEQSGWSSWFWKTATVWLFANASWWNLWLMNNTNQYTTNATYNANRADNTKTWSDANVSITTTPFWTNVNSINRMNIYYNIWWLTTSFKSIIRPTWVISNQVFANDADADYSFIPMYWNDINYLVYGYRATSTVPDEHVYIASYDISWNHINEYKVDWWYDSAALSRCWYWLWAKPNWNWQEIAMYIPDVANNTVSKIWLFNQFDTTSWNSITWIWVWWSWKYIYYLIFTPKSNSSWAWPDDNISVRAIDTETWTDAKVWWTWWWWNRWWWKICDSWNLTRIYFWKDSSWGWYENRWYVEYNRDTKAITSEVSMTQAEIDEFFSSHVSWEYSDFTNWELLVNLENTSNWIAIFNWEEVWDWYFLRWWDNSKKEYTYRISWFVIYPNNNATLNLSLNNNILRRWYSTNNGWWAVNNIWTTVAYSKSTSTNINSQNITLSLVWSWIQSTSTLTIQPTNNNIENNALLNMWDINNPTTSTWLELDIDWYTYKWEADILIAVSSVNSNTAVNINWDLTKYARVLLLRADDSNNHYWHSFEFVPKYMPSWDYKISYDIWSNRYYSTINSTRTTISTNTTVYWMLMLGYK